MLPEHELLALHAKTDIAERLAIALERAGMTQSQLAAAASVDKSYVSRVLAGNENLTVETAVKLFNAAGCRFDLIVTPKHADEWHVKRVAERIEDAFWTASSTTHRSDPSNVIDFPSGERYAAARLVDAMAGSSAPAQEPSDDEIKSAITLIA